MTSSPRASEPSLLARASLTGVTIVGALAMLCALAMPQPVTPDLALFVPALVGAASLSLAAIHLGHRVRFARLAAVLGVALCMCVEIAATGGADSVFRHVFLLLLVGAAALLTTGEFVVATPVVLAAAMLPRLAAPATPQGTTVFLDLVVWLLAAAMLHAFVRVQRDANTRLVASAARFRSLAENSGDAIFVVDLAADLVRYANPALRDFLGSDPVACAARLHSLVHPDDHHHLDAVHAAEVTRIVVRIQHHTGAWRWMAIVASPVVDEDDGVVSVQGVARDVDAETRARTALADALADRQAALDELERVDAMKSSFLTAISHELRTPLTPIMGMAHTLLADDHDLVPRHDLAAGILRNARRLARLLDDVMDVDRLADRDVHLDTSPVCLRDLLDRELDSVELDGREVRVLGAPDRVQVDATLVGRAIHHLLHNASRHTPPGTPVTIRLEDVGDAIRVVVEDDGPGIPSELRARVFEPFAQGPSPDVAVSPGTGIGLTLVRHVAELHGGSARLDTAGARGTRVVMTLARTASEARDDDVELSELAR